MKQIISLILLSCAILCASSCVTYKSDSFYSSTDELGYFSNQMVTDVIIAPVTAITQCLEQSQDIFKSGYETTMNGVYIKLLSAKDSTWAVSNALPTDMLTFSGTVKMLPNHHTGLHRWQSGGSGTYVENATYMASLETITPAVIDWLEEKKSTYFSYIMCFNGSFRVTTFLRSNAKGIDKCTISYKSAWVDNPLSFSDFKIEPIY